MQFLHSWSTVLRGARLKRCLHALRSSLATGCQGEWRAKCFPCYSVAPLVIQPYNIFSPFLPQLDPKQSRTAPSSASDAQAPTLRHVLGLRDTTRISSVIPLPVHQQQARLRESNLGLPRRRAVPQPKCWPAFLVTATRGALRGGPRTNRCLALLLLLSTMSPCQHTPVSGFLSIALERGVRCGTLQSAACRGEASE